jgi:sigma-B regulation protein RsbU (phosphoserine phosphatase)
MVLGFLPDAGYSSSVVRGLGAGDRIVFYTDGITEAAGPAEEFYGDRRFQAFLAAEHARPAVAFVEALVGDARQWAGADFADDVTVVVVDVTMGP